MSSLISEKKLKDLASGAWWLVLLEGLAAIGLGLALLFQPALTLYILVQLLGLYWLIVGAFMIVRALGWRGQLGESWGWVLVRGLIGVLAGAFVLLYSDGSAVAFVALLVYFLAAAALISGVLDLLAGLRKRQDDSRGWSMAADGIISIVFGIALLAAPTFSLTVARYFIGVAGIFAGLALIILAFTIRASAPEEIEWSE